jgi:hypothetical protein
MGAVFGKFRRDAFADATAASCYNGYTVFNQFLINIFIRKNNCFVFLQSLQRKLKNYNLRKLKSVLQFINC